MNGIPLLDSIPVNWFILGVSILAGVILFLILTQIPDEDDDKKDTSKDIAGSEPETIIEEEEAVIVEDKPKVKSKSRSRKKASRR